MRRLYFLARSLDEVDSLSRDLHHIGVHTWQIHGLSKDAAGLYHHHIHPASFFQHYDLTHLGERGALIGFIISIIWALGIHYLQLVPAAFETAESFFTIVVFTLFGAWSGGLAGLSHLNYRITRFQRDIESGACLVLVDVRPKHAGNIARRVRFGHPTITLAGTSSTFTNPFARTPKIT